MHSMAHRSFESSYGGPFAGSLLAGDRLALEAEVLEKVKGCALYLKE